MPGTDLTHFGIDGSHKLIQALDYPGPWAPLREWLGKSRFKLQGVTNGIHWMFDATMPFFKMWTKDNELLIGVSTRSTKGATKYTYGFKLYGSSEAAVKVLMFIEHIAEDIEAANWRMKCVPTHIYDFIHARKRIKEQKYPEWYGSLKDKTDEFNKMMADHYLKEYERDVRADAKIVFDNVMAMAKAHGLRFISFQYDHIVSFEGVTNDSDWPVSWAIADLLDCKMTGNGPMVSVDLYFLLREDCGHYFGVYDLRGDEPVKIAAPLQKYSSKHIDRRYHETMDLDDWIRACGRADE